MLAWEKEHKPDMEQVNVNGGAIALGHPLGASGTKLAATLLNELERTQRPLRAAQTMCEGGGLANATHHRAPGLSRPSGRSAELGRQHEAEDDDDEPAREVPRA